MLAGIASSLATSQNKSNPQSYQHLCKAWGSARISAELSKKITYSQIEQITKNPPHTQCFGVPIEYLCICVHIQKYIYTHTHTHKDSNRKGRRMKSHYIKPLNQNKIYTDLRTNSQNWTYFTMFFCSPRSRSWFAGYLKAYHLTIHLDTFQCWAMEAGKVYPYNSRLVCKFQSREHCQIERTWSWSFSYTLNAWRKPESRE